MSLLLARDPVEVITLISTSFPPQKEPYQLEQILYWLRSHFPIQPLHQLEGLNPDFEQLG
jgi:hypothetical protein